MRIGELSKRAAISRDTIRFYEKNGLIASEPGDSPSNNYRDYPEDSVLTLALIKEAQAAGFTIAELIIFISQVEASREMDFDGEAFLQRKIDQVEAKIARSKRFLKTLKMTKEALGSAV